MVGFWLAENVWTLRFEDDTKMKRILHIEKQIIQQYSNDIHETIATTQSISVYTALSISSERAMELEHGILTLAQQSFELQEETQRIVEIPVLYGGEAGPDLSFVAALHNLTEQQVIERHTRPLYPVSMIGFAPGFPYLSGLDKDLHTPRKMTPRTKIAAGSVGIAGAQTGIYSISTPGGWQIIGRTKTELFLPNQHPPSLLEPGDLVRFIAVNEEEEHD